MTVGTLVRLKDGKQRARIVEEDDAFAEGAVRLNRALAGFRWWNKSDLVEVEQMTPPSRLNNREEPNTT